MRELEFLPGWYPQARRRRRWLRLHSLLSILLLAGLGLWILLAQRNVSNAQAGLRAVDRQLAQSRLELDQLEVELKLKSQLEVQRQIVSKLGLEVEMSRLLRTIDQCMPKEMSLLQMSVDTEEVQQKVTTPAPRNAPATEKAKDRRLKIRLLAVAPSDVDHLNFLAGLTNTPFFQEVTLTFARDKSDGGHMMREFEVTFTMSLNSSIGE